MKSLALLAHTQLRASVPVTMLAPAPRGRIIALDVLVSTPNSPFPAQWMIVVKTTRFDDGHIIAWHIEQDGEGRCWPSKNRLDPSLLYTDASERSMKAMGIYQRWSFILGPKPMCLDDLESICLRSSMPDEELGEDHGSWCLDILFKLESLKALVTGQALQLESHLGLFPISSAATSLLSDNPEEIVRPSSAAWYSKDFRPSTESLGKQHVAHWPPERPWTPESLSLAAYAVNQTRAMSWSPIPTPSSSLMV